MASLYKELEPEKYWQVISDRHAQGIVSYPYLAAAAKVRQKASHNWFRELEEEVIKEVESREPVKEALREWDEAVQKLLECGRKIERLAPHLRSVGNWQITRARL
jgi:hypothetical protein